MNSKSELTKKLGIKQVWNVEQKWLRLLITCSIAASGGFLFQWLHAPIPWLLGSMTAVLLASRQPWITLYWPSNLRNIGLLFIGYSIGQSFTREAAIQIVYQLPSIFFMTATLLLLCIALAGCITKLTGIDYPTILTGSIPGGLSQMMALAEEVKGIDVTTVMFLQITRIVVLVFSLPLFIFSPLFGGEVLAAEVNVATELAVGEVLLFVFLSILFVLLGKRLKLPTAYITGPAIGIALLSIAGLQGPELTSSLLIVPQLLIGSYAGLLLKPEKLPSKGKMLMLAITSSLIMVLCSWGMSIVLVEVYNIAPTTSFLSVAPGGIDQTGIIGHEIGADLSTITSYQLFRLFFIYFAVPPMLRWFFAYRARREKSQVI